MSNIKEIQEIYTKKLNLYHLIFFKILKCDKAIQSFFQKENYLHSGDKVLDAGCGSGLLTKVLFNITKEKNIQGVLFNSFDITKAMLDIFNKWINKNKITNIKTKQIDVLKLKDLPNNWKDYDLVVSSGMLEYLSEEEIEIALRNFKILLKDNGTIIIFITKDNFLTNLIIKKWWKANTYKKKEIEDILFRAGFCKIKFKQFPIFYKHIRRGTLIIELKK